MSNELTTTQQPQVPEAIEASRTTVPLVDIYENTDEILLVADLPGVGADALDVRLDNGELTIFGRRQGVPEGQSLGVEYETLNFARVFRIPRQVDAEKIVAEMREGVLSLHLPKAAGFRPRQIAVRAG